MTKHVDIVLSGQKVSKMSDHRPNEQNDLQCLIKCFKFYQTRSVKQDQTRSATRKMLGHQTMFDHVWWTNISCLDRA